MKRRLITQMLREWKANVWLILELVIVVLILQYLLGTLYALYRQHGYAGGQKLEDVYFADFGILQRIAKDTWNGTAFIPGSRIWTC